jgi:hypothetical protein
VTTKRTNKEVYRRTVEKLAVLKALNLLRVVPLVSINRVHFSHIIVRWFIINNGKMAVIISVNFNVTYNIITFETPLCQVNHSFSFCNFLVQCFPRKSY